MRTAASSPCCRGHSLTELIIAISVVGVLAAIAIPVYGTYMESSKNTVADNLKETLNSAVHRFNECNYELLVTKVDGDASDELAVVRTLEYRKPSNPAVGSPYIIPTYNPVASGDTNDYRLAWTGSLFTLLVPGQSGVGLKVSFDGSDQGARYVFPAGYSMAGQ